MSPKNMKRTIAITRLLPAALVVMVLLVTPTAHAAAPGITGPSFNLTAEAAFISQPDGAMVYSWGYGCKGAPTGFNPPASKMQGANCPSMQIPGPTLIVTQGDTVSVTLTNSLPVQAGNTSILFPGFAVTASAVDATLTGPKAGLLTTEAPPGGAVTYTFTASTPGTRAYYSGSQGDLQVEMGLYGTIIVLPNGSNATCPHHNGKAEQVDEQDFRLSPTGTAYGIAASCYDREYLFQFSEMDPNIHRQAEEIANCKGTGCPANMNAVVTEPYHPAYYMINGRSMPDDMDPNYALQYPHQPYNGNPHMHPGELVLLRIVGTGRWQHPFHEHGNHVRVLARDGNLLLAPNSTTTLAGPLLFTTSTTPGLAMDGIFYWTGKGLNWDVFGHTAAHDPGGCNNPDSNGYNTNVPDTAPNYYEWCPDHLKALEKNPFSSDVAKGGPVTLPDANILADGAWYGGSPYLGPEATARSVAPTPIPPSGTVANDPGSEAGFAFMWHSHNEREITTNNIFPGGMMMMMLVDPRAYQINESN
ncbi:MAG TPA: multicopper oxidase family protein [Terriglobales bacterium]|nr:multicopper oxidase family protein [Terriglobales bacterium]